MQISLYTLITRELSLEESLEQAVAAGFPAVDLRQGRDAADTVHLSQSINDGEAEIVRGQVEAAGLHVSGLTSYYSLGKTDPALAQLHLEGLRRALQVAQLLGAKFLRCSGPLIDADSGYEKCREAFRRQVETISASAVSHGITLTIEQHGGAYFASAGQIVDMTRGLALDHVGIVFDPGNCLAEGYERPSVQEDMLLPLIKAVHVKNMMPHPSEGSQPTINAPATRLDEGMLDWPAIVAQLRAGGFDGYLTLEDFYGEFGSLAEKLSWDAQYLARLAAGE
ncbi:MAG TPA: sugar phosphate isomerase/epimerase family protein [Armatimonadota bacterium]|jgi:sugar phosphate isomerase/epimerase